TTAYATMLRLCHGGAAREKRPPRARHGSWPSGPWRGRWPDTASHRCAPRGPRPRPAGPPVRPVGHHGGGRAGPRARAPAFVALSGGAAGSDGVRTEATALWWRPWRGRGGGHRPSAAAAHSTPWAVRWPWVSRVPRPHRGWAGTAGP